MKIEINTNCKNGEHVFIPANTFVDGRDHFVTSFVCQHCLQGVSNNEWNTHLKKLEDQEIAKANLEIERMTQSRNMDEIKLSTVGKAGDVLNLETQQWETPTKKRGPKPKGKIEGLPID